jgi:large subunit ribosomal protein L6
MECFTNSGKNLNPIMSRHDNTRIIDIPDQVQVKSKPGFMKVSGPLGSILINLAQLDPKAKIAWKYNDTSLFINAASPALAGLWYGKISSLFHGVTRGHSASLTLRGIGYRTRVEGQNVYLKLGLSHDILYRIPEGVQVYAPDPVTLILFGIDASQVNQVAASLIHLRKPSAYQSKGIYKTNSVYPRKAGKRK